MKVAIYSPYLDTLGGGEKYMMTIAEVLSAGHEVDILLDLHLLDFGENYFKNNFSKRFNLDLSNVNFVKGPVGKGSNFLQRLAFLKSYDVLFYLTDGSFFYPNAKKNILHIQTPLVGQAKTLFGKLKLQGWNLIIYNSKFTQKYSQKNWPIPSKVIYPPVDTNKIKPLKKEKYILSVGRFFGYLKSKRHELLIKLFKKLHADKKLDGWSLHLVGSASLGDNKYIENLKILAKGTPVNFYPNLGYHGLIKLYGQSRIYWHAQGFGENDPTKVEHFGISTVEAMAGGCVPVVIGKGGQIEIVENGKSGFLWNNLEELENRTNRLISSSVLWKYLSNQASIRARIFNKEKFAGKIKQLI